MTTFHSATFALLWLACLPCARAALSADEVKSLPPPAARPVSFAKDVQPVLESGCVKCHGRGRSQGGFQIDTRETLLKGGDSGPAVIAGKSGESLLIELVSGLDPDNVMPRKGSRLTAEQVGILRAWIDQGVEWDGKITFARREPQNLTPRGPRSPVSLSSPANPVDQILKPYYAAHRVTPGGPVEDRVYARRVWLDTIGLLPAPEELEAFVRDEQPGKRVKLVRKLLADDERYAAHWLSFWNDLLRNDYRGTGFIDGGRKQITGWLLASLKTNLPYDQFVSRLVNPVPETEGFTKGIVWRGVVNSSQTPEMQAAQNIAQVFMGVNLKCASCHDSLINDWRLADAYGLASIYSEGPLEMFQCDKPTGRTAAPAFIYPELGAIDPQADKPARLARLAELITGPKDGRLPRTVVNRLWARFFGRGLVDPVDDMEQSAWDPDLLDWLAEDLVNHKYDLKRTLEQVLTSEAYQMPAVSVAEQAGADYVFRGPAIRRLSAEQFRDAVGQLTGVWGAKSEVAGITNAVRACFTAADPLMTSMGRPNREQVVTTRASLATTLQALELTNGETLAGVLRRGSEKLLASGGTAEALIDRLYGAAFGRRSSPQERDLALQLVGQPPQREGVEDLLWAMAMVPEFQLIY